jgi:lysophospholipase L1-like esterase
MICAPGQSIACVGPGACPGGQACNADGRGYGLCNCGSGAGGSPGTGGQPVPPGAGGTPVDGSVDAASDVSSERDVPAPDAAGDALPGWDGAADTGADARVDGDAESGSGVTIGLGSDGKLTIWTIGDSMTNNSGYRTRMCTTLTGEGYSVWFVGSLKGGGTPCNQNDNDGHSGFAISGIVDGVSGSGTYADWYDGISPKPQLATLLIGTNDIAWWVADGTVMADIADECMALADKILALDPKLLLIVGTIPPESSTVVQAINRDRADLANEYNAALRLKVPGHAQYGRRLFLADTGSALTVADLYDGIHPNATGQVRIGDAWLSVLTPLLPAP